MNRTFLFCVFQRAIRESPLQNTNILMRSPLIGLFFYLRKRFYIRLSLVCSDHTGELILGDAERKIDIIGGDHEQDDQGGQRRRIDHRCFRIAERGSDLLGQRLYDADGAIEEV